MARHTGMKSSVRMDGSGMGSEMGDGSRIYWSLGTEGHTRYWVSGEGERERGRHRGISDEAARCDCEVTRSLW